MIRDQYLDCIVGKNRFFANYLFFIFLSLKNLQIKYFLYNPPIRSFEICSTGQKVIHPKS